MAQTNKLPPGAVGLGVFDTNAPDLDAQLAKFSDEARATLKKMGVSGCVAATKLDGSRLEIVVFPAAKTSAAGAKDGLSSASEEVKRTIHDAAKAAIAKAAPQTTAAALGPRPTGGAGIGLRPGPKKR